MMKKIALLSLLVIPLMLVSSTPYAIASSELNCTDGGGDDILDGAPHQIGETFSCEGDTDNAKAAFHQARVIDPNGVSRYDSGLVAGTECDIPTQTLDTNGVWFAGCFWFTSSGGQVGHELINIIVSFLVVPESTIGTLALIGSSLAGLGAFVGLRYRTKPI